jgi:hypothetical protein
MLAGVQEPISTPNHIIEYLEQFLSFA